MSNKLRTQIISCADDNNKGKTGTAQVFLWGFHKEVMVMGTKTSRRTSPVGGSMGTKSSRSF